jgi:hypothetical protein
MTTSHLQDEYRSAILACAMAVRILSVHDLQKMLNAISSSEGIGPILHPALYREKAKAMEEDKQLLRAALPLWEMAKRMSKKESES